MIAFSPIRTRRLSAQIKELTVSDVIFLCKLRPDFREAGTTELLRRIIEVDPKPRIGQVTDVRYWTVQERALCVAHYIAHTSDGSPDFAVGEGKFSDYLLEGVDFAQESTEVGEVGGDQWFLRPLLGIHAEAIERLVSAGHLEAARHGWWLGAMAAQMFRGGEEADQSAISESEVEELIADRAQVLKGFPESVFMALLSRYLATVEQQNHLFRLAFDADGVVFLPKGEAGIPPARFPFDSAISEGALAVFGNA